MLRALIIAIGLLAAGAAAAADNGVYLGAGVARSDIKSDDSFFDGDDTKFKIIAGVRPLDWLAFEVNYVDFGEIEGPVGSLELKGYDAFALGLFEVGLVDFFVKAGVVRFDQKTDFFSPEIDDGGLDPAYGAGVQAHFGSIGARLEYERFENDDLDDASTLSVSVTWTFL
jgi:hypothetical protein